MDYILIALGGALGGTARYGLGKLISKRFKSVFPLATFCVNITGAVLFGLFFAANTGVSASLFFGEGFFGAYTTFSTFMYEGFCLLRSGEKISFIAYVIGAVITGVIGFYLGYIFGLRLF